MNKTNNFIKLSNWLPRLIILSLIFGIVIFALMQTHYLNTNLLIIIGIIYLLLIAVNQIEEIEIKNDLMILEQKSILFFLNSKIEIPYETIENLRLISNQTMNERGWFMFRKNKNILIITKRDGQILRINGNIYPRGSKVLMKVIQEEINKLKI
jgi:hypothetical protein